MARISDEEVCFLYNDLRIAKGSFALFPMEILAVFRVSNSITESTA